MRPHFYLLDCLILGSIVSCIFSACIRPATTPSNDPIEYTDKPPSTIQITHQPANTSLPAINLQPSSTSETIREYDVQEIYLKGAASKIEAEISGLAWYEDYLIMLPQFPSRFSSDGDGSLFAIHKQKILEYLISTNPPPIEPLMIPIYTGDLENRISGFEGFEAISIYKNQIYLTVEARPQNMQGYLTSGRIAQDLSAIALDPNLLIPIDPPTDLPNSSFEALTIFGHRLMVLFEANGVLANPDSTGLLFDLELTLQDELPFPNIEYRITDATNTSPNGQFWAINYFYPGDTFLETKVDPIADEYGEGASHSIYPQVERLIAFQFTEQGIERGEPNPIQLKLAADGSPRNWEGIASLDNIGFLVVTDKHPNTILGYVAYP